MWRSAELASSMSLTRIHAILQTVFGWYDEHLHRFTAADPYERLKPVNGEIVEPPQWLPAEFCDAPTDLPEEECSLDDLLKAGDGTAFYENDFGDSWLHRLDLTSWRRRKPTDPPARILNGARSGPLEDSGGMPGYEQILDTLANPSHEDHEQVSRWVAEITDIG